MEAYVAEVSFYQILYGLHSLYLSHLHDYSCHHHLNPQQAILQMTYTSQVILVQFFSLHQHLSRYSGVKLADGL